MSITQPRAICLMGPTASGKSQLALQMVEQFPCEIISVDSALIYRGMDIGTAKPEQAILEKIPHHLINILDPKESYSAGKFRVDAKRLMDDITARNKIPLLVGGTMLYFRVLQQGIATLPQADEKIRAILAERIQQEGIEALHGYLASVDPDAASRIHAHDSQRIQRALEVYLVTGNTLTSLQENTDANVGYDFFQLAIAPQDRTILHTRIAKRFELMLQLGFIDEVKRLYDRGDLSADLPSIRSVGYRQVWEYLAGQYTDDQMREKAIAATRQLAKRQLTWLRSWPNVHWFDSEAADLFEKVTRVLGSNNFC